MLNSWPYFSSEEQNAVQSVLSSGRVNYWTGEQGKLFEEEFSAYCGCKFGVALANGTLALELALRAADIGEDDEVVVTPRTFIASASAIIQVGATPVFADIDSESQNITAESIERVLTNKTKAVICVHLGGWPCDMDPILELSIKHRLIVIEDCAQAHGAKYKGRPVGSLGDLAAFSFCQDKIMSTGGEGGMLVTNNEDYWKKAWSFKDHGKDWDEIARKDHPPGFRWLHTSFGSNYRMTEMQAAIGRIQLKKLDRWRDIRSRNASKINGLLKNSELARCSVPPVEICHAFYKHYVFLRADKFKKGWSRERLMAEINARGVPCYSGSCSEIYLERAFESSKKDIRPAYRLPVAKELGETSLMFLVHPTITEDQIQESAEIIADCFNLASI